MLWGKVTFYVFLLAGANFLFAEPNSFPASPFSDPELRPIISLNGDRVTKVDGVSVPPGAHFYRFNNGVLQFLDQNKNAVSPGTSNLAPIDNNSGSTPFQGFLSRAPLAPLGGESTNFSQDPVNPVPLELPHGDSLAQDQPKPRPIAPPRKFRAATNSDIQKYENLKYITGNLRERFSYPDNVFNDIPKGGTGKIIIAYFGNEDREDLKRMVAGNPLVEVRRYPIGSPEHQHAKLFGVQALGIDGLGRKITRYAMDPSQALQGMLQSEEPVLLGNYLRAKGAGSTVEPEAAQPKPHSVAPKAPISDHGLSEEYIELAPPKKEREIASPGEFNPQGMHQVIDQSCNKCHAKGLATPFPAFISNWNQWRTLLDAKDPNALDWLKKFNSKVVHGEMLTNSGLSRTAGVGKAFSDFIEHESNKRLSQAPAKTKFGSNQATQMVSPERLNEYLSVLKNANIGDAALKHELLDFDSIYDPIGNPQWSWAPHGGDSGRKGQRPVGSATPAQSTRDNLFEQVNGVWKWREPFNDGFAIDKNTKGIEKFTLVRFPRDANGNIIKGVRGTEARDRMLSNTSSSGVSRPTPDSGDLDNIWASFPQGTKVYEIFYSRINGKPVAVDVLSREKRISQSGSQAFWVPDAIRQDSSPEKIARWVKSQPNWQSNKELQSILNAVNNPRQDAVVSKLGTGETGGTPFVINGKRSGEILGSKSVLPAGISQATLLKMYQELPMESSAGSKGWQLEAHDIFANTHRGLPVDTNTCMNCHNQAGEAFKDVFENARLPNSGVYEYGNMQGYDGVLSAPWFSPEALSQYGSKVRFDMRSEWGKFFKDYNKQTDFTQRFIRTERWNVSDQELRSR